jgi:hypothetical protein
MDGALDPAWDRAGEEDADVKIERDRTMVKLWPVSFV